MFMDSNMNTKNVAIKEVKPQAVFLDIPNFEVDSNKLSVVPSLDLQFPCVSRNKQLVIPVLLVTEAWVN